MFGQKSNEVIGSLTLTRSLSLAGEKTNMAHETHHVNYLAVFVALCVFTALSVGFDLVRFENHAITIVLVLAVAVAKALCVMMFFMHLKFEGNWKFVLLAPTTILAIGLPLALMPDIGVAYYTSIAPQKESWSAEMNVYHAEHADSDNTDSVAENASGEHHE